MKSRHTERKVSGGGKGGTTAGEGTRRRGLFEARELVARDDAVLLEGIGPVIDVGIAVVGAVEGFGTG